MAQNPIERQAKPTTEAQAAKADAKRAEVQERREAEKVRAEQTQHAGGAETRQAESRAKAIAEARAREEEDKKKKEQLEAQLAVRISLLEMLGIKPGGHADPETEQRIGKVAEGVTKDDVSKEELVETAAALTTLTQTTESGEVPEEVKEKILVKAEEHELSQEELDAEANRFLVEQQQFQQAGESSSSVARNIDGDTHIIPSPEGEGRSSAADDQIIQLEPSSTDVRPNADAGEIIEQVQEELHAAGQDLDLLKDRLAEQPAEVVIEAEPAEPDAKPQIFTEGASPETVDSLVHEAIEHPIDLHTAAEEVSSLIIHLPPEEQAAADRLVQRLNGEGEHRPLDELQPETLARELVESIPDQPVKDLTVQQQRVAEIAFQAYTRALADKGEAVDEIVAVVIKKGEHASVNGEQSEAGKANKVTGNPEYDEILQQGEDKMKDLIKGTYGVEAAGFVPAPQLELNEEGQRIRRKAEEMGATKVVAPAKDAGATAEGSAVIPPADRNDRTRIRIKDAEGNDTNIELETYDIFSDTEANKNTYTRDRMTRAIERKLDEIRRNPDWFRRIVEADVGELVTVKFDNSDVLQRIAQRARDMGDLEDPMTITHTDPAEQDRLRSIVEVQNSNNQGQLNLWLNDMETFANKLARRAFISKEAHDTYLEQINLAKNADYNEKKILLHDISLDLSRHFARLREGGYAEERINSFQSLCRLIMEAERDIFREGGAFALMENGKVIPEHFIAWVRERMLYFADLNPDSQVNFDQDIYIPLSIRVLTLKEILSTPQYMRDEVEGWQDEIINEDKGKTQINPEALTVYSNQNEKIRNEAIYLSWLGMVDHNNQAKHRLMQSELQTVTEFQKEAFYFDTWTATRHRLRWLLHLSGTDNDAERDPMNAKAIQEMKTIEGENFKNPGKVGRAFRRLTLAYMFLPDEEMLQNRFLKKQGMEVFYKTVISQVFQKHIDAYNAQIKKENKQNGTRKPLVEDLFNLTQEQRDGVLRQIKTERGLEQFPDDDFDDMINATNLNRLRRIAVKALKFRIERKSRTESWNSIKVADPTSKNEEDRIAAVEDFGVFNFFNSNKIDTTHQNIVREAIRQAVARIDNHMVWVEEGGRRISARNSRDIKKRHAYERDKLDMKFADFLAFAQAPWTGISGSVETGAITFDKTNALFSTREYRIREMEARKGFGQYENIHAFERVALNFWQMAKLKRGDHPQYNGTALEMLMGVDFEALKEQGKDLSKIDLAWVGDPGMTEEQIKNDPRYVEFHLDDYDSSEYYENLDFDFEKETMKRYYTDHFSRAVKFYTYLHTMGWHFDKILSFDPKRNEGNLDRDTGMKEVEGVWDDIRYFLDNGGILWDHPLRVWQKKQHHNHETDQSERVVEFGTRLTRNAMMGNEIHNINAYDRPEFGETPAKRKEVEEKNMARKAFIFMLRTYAEHGRKRHTGHKRWGAVENQAFKDYFTKFFVLKAHEVMEEKNGEMVPRMHPSAFFLTDEEYEKEIADPAGLGKWKMRGISVAAGTGEAGFASIVELFRQFFKQLGR